MLNDAHREHELCRHIVWAYRNEARLLDKLMAKSFKTPSSELIDIAVNHFAIQRAREQVSNSTKPIHAIRQDKCHQLLLSGETQYQSKPELLPG